MLLPAYGSDKEQNLVSVVVPESVSDTITVWALCVLDTASVMVVSLPDSSIISEQAPSTDTVLPGVYSKLPAA